MSDKDDSAVGGRHAKIALSLLVIVYIFNFVDRQIISILAEDIKADLGISNSDIGFLFGTAFGVFYSCLLYTSPSPRDMRRSRMPSSA